MLPTLSALLVQNRFSRAAKRLQRVEFKDWIPRDAMTSENHQAFSAMVGTNPRRKVLPTLLLAGSVLIGFAALYLHLTFGRPVGSGPAGPMLDRSPFAHVWTSRPVFLVGLGDSVTFGFGARRGYGYFDRLVSNPPDEFPEMKGICLSSVLPHLTTTNLSVSGSISLELAESQLPLLPTNDPGTLVWVVITTGGNDLIHNYGRTPPREQAMYGATWEQSQPWINKFGRRLDEIMARLSAKFSGGCEVFLANIYDPTDGVGDVQRAGLPAWSDGSKVLNAYNETIRHCAEAHSNVHLVNFHDAFLGHGIHCAQFWSKHYHSNDPHYWYFANLEDPNERGYDAIRRLFLQEMVKAGQRLQVDAR